MAYSGTGPNARLGRRHALLGLAAVAATPGEAATTPAPESAVLLVAGPPGSRADRWADALSPALGRALPGGGDLPRQNVGGADGVTGANQFEARAAPDGSTAMLVPGAAALSWLGGESRVRFDAARWIPLWASCTGGVLASRVRLAPGQPVRLAVSAIVGPELPALLTLDLMGIEAVPVPGVPDPAAALARPDIDAVFLAGPAWRADAAAASAGGMVPVLSLGALDAAGHVMRDPAYPELPTSMESIIRAGQDPQPALLAALRAAIVAAQLDVALVLPQLCPASMVALWRRGCATLGQSQPVQAEAARAGARLMGTQGTTISTAAIALDAPTLLALRRWLSARHGWQPG